MAGCGISLQHSFINRNVEHFSSTLFAWWQAAAVRLNTLSLIAVCEMSSLPLLLMAGCAVPQNVHLIIVWAYKILPVVNG
jgi:hypothetical protein